MSAVPEGPARAASVAVAPIEGSKRQTGPSCATRESVRSLGLHRHIARLGALTPPHGRYLRNYCLRTELGLGTGCRRGPRGKESPPQTLPGWTQVAFLGPLMGVLLVLVFYIHRWTESESSECEAMAQKSPVGNGLNLLYKDLASEVTRRRFTMATRYSELMGQAGPEAAGDAGVCKCIQMYSCVCVQVCSSMAVRRQIL